MQALEALKAFELAQPFSVLKELCELIFGSLPPELLDMYMETWSGAIFEHQKPGNKYKYPLKFMPIFERRPVGIATVTQTSTVGNMSQLSRNVVRVAEAFTPNRTPGHIHAYLERGNVLLPEAQRPVLTGVDKATTASFSHMADRQKFFNYQERNCIN